MPQALSEPRKGDNRLVRRNKRPMFNKVEEVGPSPGAAEDAPASMRFVARDEGWKTQD